jgi:hypothetical protein
VGLYSTCILDNVDDDRLLCWFPGADKGDPTRGPTNASTKPLLEYVPRSLNGFTIITSRASGVALKMVDHKDIIEVQPMERSEALTLTPFTPFLRFRAFHLLTEQRGE